MTFTPFRNADQGRRYIEVRILIFIVLEQEKTNKKFVRIFLSTIRHE